MQIFRRFFYFIAMNVAIILMISIIMMLLSVFFGINLGTWSYAWLAIFALIYGMAASFISLQLSRWMAKRAYKLQLITNDNIHEQNARIQKVHNSIARITQEQWLPMPEVGVYEHASPNAFATWPSKKKSLIAVSTWLMDLMNDAEVEWVLAHEIAHIKNGDMVTMTLLQWVINAFVIFLARAIAQVVAFSGREEGSTFMYYGVVIWLDLILSLFGSLLLMRFSRWREFRADAGSSRFVWRDKMVAALQKLATHSESQAASRRSRKQKWDNMAPAMIAHFDENKMSLFSSHPPLKKRIEALNNLPFDM